MKQGFFFALKSGEWEEYKSPFRTEVKVTEWSFDRIKEAFEKVAKDQAGKLRTVKEIMIISADYLRRIIAPAGDPGSVTMSYLCPHCNSSTMEDYVWWVSGTGSNHNRLLVMQTGESVNQAKVFKAHAVPQGLCGKLINALKLLANQQEDGDGLIQNIVTNLCEGSRQGLTEELRKFMQVDNHRALEVGHLRVL